MATMENKPKEIKTNCSKCAYRSSRTETDYGLSLWGSGGHRRIPTCKKYADGYGESRNATEVRSRNEECDDFEEAVKYGEQAKQPFKVGTE